ncbi:RNA polymerase sigma factor (sigma-70 family) [Actinomadura pelletieri DSM 43383]|uniref:RNA polymerase sigma factor (Sigma-70 family) n=1 Tax=Actinomadura pelletieri DSM 43383 TaxID=1120940 RepID=A0A495QZ88_9ACTN|nr:sigma-70 family RNA polymerase sigma factor [Actinomadura pelletieri]RKS79531.1 RNA polymerase sigma factor (sigma-70 family) [Actinomadura pelletieri DSM 43383]
MPRLSPYADASDRILVKGLHDGDDRALAALYDRYGERIYDYALSMSGDEKVAADIVHDTFIDACRRAPRMRDHLYLSSWLYGAARRRCIRRGRAKHLFWDRDAEFSDVPLLTDAEPDAPAPDWPPFDELHGLLRACLARLTPAEQEIMLLAFRHGLRPARLGATLGLSSRRAATRVRRGRANLETALRKEISRADRACASATKAEDVPEEPRSTAVAVLAARAPAKKEAEPPPATEPPGGRRPPDANEPPPTDPSTEQHVADCPACLRRSRVTTAALLSRAPAPVLPAALRHRVMHTATDPELAGYRADIAARGGTLTPSGLPSQPDVPSPFTKRWLFTGGAMAGALAAALIAVFSMGTGIDGDPLSWPPFRTDPQPSITHESPQDGTGHGRPAARAPGGGPEGGPGSAGPGGAPNRPGQSPVAPPSAEKPAENPSSPAPPSSDPPPARPGVLVVGPGKVELYGKKTADVFLSAKQGPVQWTVTSSTDNIVLSKTRGDMPENGETQVTLTLREALLRLPGRATLTFTDTAGDPHTIAVVWGASLL